MAYKKASTSSSSLEGNDDDPFISLKEQMIIQMKTIKTKYEQYQRLISTVDTSTNQEFKDLRKNLVKDIRAIDQNHKALVQSLIAIEKNRLKFPHIKNDEITNRQKFISSINSSVGEIKSGMESVNTRKKMESDEIKNKNNIVNDSHAALVKGAEMAIEKDNDRFINNQKQQTLEMINRQDESLDHLGQAVDRLGHISRSVNEELKEQNVMLDHLEKDMTVASSNMDQVQKMLGKLLKTKDGCQIWTIVILALILIVLVALIIWT